jgi:hypothetical protein
MAYQPIVLSSNLVSDGNIGALPGLAYSIPDEDRTAIVTNEDGTITVPTYQLASNTPTFDLQNMQNIYGTKYMPMFRWISQKQTGSVTFDPDEGQISEEEAERLRGEFESDTGMSAEEALKEQYKQEAIGVGSQLAAGIGGQIGRAYAQTGDFGEALGSYGEGGAVELLGYGANNDPTRLTSKISASGPFDQGRSQFELASLDTPAGKAATAAIKSTPKNPLDADASQNYLKSIEAGSNASDTDKAVSLARANEYKDAMAAIPETPKGWFENMTDRGKSLGPNATSAGKANLYGSAGAGIGAIAANLIAGKNLRESVESGAKVGVGTYVGTLIGGPLGGMIGGLLGGRVICNELMRQKIMTRKQVVMDYKFTKDYLTPQHVAGYHIWAVWMVRQMRKGRLVNFWAHVAGHRANEIAYIYGKRDKPDYLGKVYRKVLEPICWSIGLLCKKTDWEVLYKQKEV